MTYDELLRCADEFGLTAKEKDLHVHDGLIMNDRVAIRRNLETMKKKACVLAEELGHYCTSSGNILDQTSVGNQKQEARARMWAYDKMIGLDGIVECWREGLHTVYEMAEHCGVDEEFMAAALEAYRGRYGMGVWHGDHYVYFEPCLGVMRVIGSEER